MSKYEKKWGLGIGPNPHILKLLLIIIKFQINLIMNKNNSFLIK